MAGLVDHVPGPDLQARVAHARYETAHGSKKRAKKLWRSARKAAIKLLRSGKSFTFLEDTCHVSRQWLHTWWNRWIDGGKHWSCLDERSSRPRTLHTKRDPYVDKILAARDEHRYGAHKLQHVLGLRGRLSHATIHDVLRQAGRVKPARKRRKKTWTRFQRSQPNHLWQLDVTQWPLNDGEGPKAWILSAIDDHSRFVLGTQVHGQELNAGDTIRFLRAMFGLWGTPRAILTDNGSEFENNGTCSARSRAYSTLTGSSTSRPGPSILGASARSSAGTGRSRKSGYAGPRPPGPSMSSGIS